MKFTLSWLKAHLETEATVDVPIDAYAGQLDDVSLSVAIDVADLGVLGAAALASV